MKKTWTTKVLIALLTLALVAGAFIVAPKEAQAAGELSIDVSGLKTKGKLNEEYASSISASGGDGAYTFSLAAGAFPDGLDWANDATGAISGIPTKGGKFSVQFLVTDGTGATKASSYVDIVINSGPTAINTPDDASVGVGEQVNLDFSASGGYPNSYDYTLVGDTVPGMKLSGGTYSGKPTKAGTYSVQVKAQYSTTKETIRVEEDK